MIDTLAGTATPSLDYTNAATVTFPAGSSDGTSVSLRFTPLDDGALEPDETATLSLSTGELLVACEGLGALDPEAVRHTVTLAADDHRSCPCDDGDPCTIDRCDETGACTFTPVEPRQTPDATCDGLDDNRNGLTDEDCLGVPETCGENACAMPSTTRSEAGEVVSGCDPLWQSSSDLGDDLCPPEGPEEVAYALAYQGPRAVGTIRCVNRPGEPTPVRCDTESATSRVLKIHEGLYCRGADVVNHVCPSLRAGRLRRATDQTIGLGLRPKPRPPLAGPSASAHRWMDQNDGAEALLPRHTLLSCGAGHFTAQGRALPRKLWQSSHATVASMRT